MTSVGDLSSISQSYWDDEMGVRQESPDKLQDSWKEDKEGGSLTTELFGRSDEIALLQRTFHHVVTEHTVATVVVHGESGVGKTCLVDTLRQPVLESSGYFTSGKFFQNSGMQEPYSAIMAAFSDICDLVTQSPDFDEKRRCQVRDLLGSEGHLLTNVISNVSTFLCERRGDSREVEEGDQRVPDVDVFNESSLPRFRVTCKTFLKAISSGGHPLVIFIDDIQWMDVGSRQLLQFFIDDNEMKNVLFILAYRDEEAEHVTSIFRDDSGGDLVDIQLRRLDSDAICELVYNIIGEKSERVRELGQLVEKRTSGNPLHVQAFLDMIDREGLIRNDSCAKSLIFDIEEIQSSIMASTSLADLLSQHIEQVDNDVKTTLKVASLMGYHFSEAVLVETVSLLDPNAIGTCPSSNVQSPKPQNATQSLRKAVEIGFIEEFRDGYQFTHDKIQAGFCNMVADECEEEHIHHLLGHTTISLGADNDATMYRAAMHLNRSLSAVTSDKDRLQWITINLRAAKHCMSKSAFAAAGNLLRETLDSLTYEERWSDMYFDLTFEMTELHARADLVIGNADGCQSGTKECLANARTSEMKLNSFLLDVEVRLTINQNIEAISCAISALNACGIKMPRRVTVLHVLYILGRTSRCLRKRPDEAILSLPIMRNKSIQTAITMLWSICENGMLVDKSEIAVYAALKAVLLTLEHGLSSSSPLAFSVYGIALSTIGDHKKAYRYGKLALRLLDVLQCSDSRCGTVAHTITLIIWRQESMLDLYRGLGESADFGFEVGDIARGAYCRSQAIGMGILLGENLHNLIDCCRETWDRVVELGQDKALQWIQPYFQYILNLQTQPNDWKSVMIMTGEVMNEDEYRDEHLQRRPPVASIVPIMKMYAASFFRYYKETLEFPRQLGSLGKAMEISFARIPWLFHTSFAYFELFRESGKPNYLRKARNRKRKLEELVRGGCDGGESFVIFLCAVDASMKKSVDSQQLQKIYERQISLLAEKDNFCLEGFLNEQAGFDFAWRGNLTQARIFFERGLYVYSNKWCSNAKYQWLTEMCEQYFTDFQCEENVILSMVGEVITCD